MEERLDRLGKPKPWGNHGFGYLFVRARPCFWNGVFRGPKNGMTKTNKPPAMRVVEIASAYSKKPPML